jgi:hypothetical protein
MNPNGNLSGMRYLKNVIPKDGSAFNLLGGLKMPKVTMSNDGVRRIDFTVKVRLSRSKIENLILLSPKAGKRFSTTSLIKYIKQCIVNGFEENFFRDLEGSEPYFKEKEIIDNQNALRPALEGMGFEEDDREEEVWKL